MSNVVKFFSSYMEGAPVLSDTWGQMTALLDACLVDGFNSKTPTSITRSGTTVTVTFAAHKFIVNQVILISGANETGYNGEWRITSVTGTTLTFETALTPATPATGTITVKAAPLGFERQFTATNRRVFRSTNASSNKTCLRVDDFLPLNAGGTSDYTTTYAKHARVGMAQAMSDINTVVGAQAPYDPTNPNRNWITTGTTTAIVSGWYKWYWSRYPTSSAETTQDTSAKQWYLIGDDRGFYLFNSTWSTGNNYGTTGYCFMDFESYKTGDAFNTILAAADWSSNVSASVYTSSGNFFNSTIDYTGKILMKDHTQQGSPVRAAWSSLNTNNGNVQSGYSTGVAWPNGADYSLLIHPVYIRQENGHMRGRIPGLYWVHNDSSPLTDQDIISGITGYESTKFLVIATQPSNITTPSGRVLIDITGPWW